MRYFLEIAYKGTAYHGWQVQANDNTVQLEINNALRKLFREEIVTYGSGRTDSGVHAEQQFVQVDLNQEFTENHLFKLNCMIPYDISVKNFYKVVANANARHDATCRGYEYRMHTVKDPFLIDLSYFFPRPLDLEMMNQASKILFEYSDFQSFSKVHTDVDHFLCNILKAEWIKSENSLVFIIEGNRFLRGMVRTIVGTMLEVGLGRMTLDQFRQVIESKDRRKAGQAVPPEGLFLNKVVYPKEIFL